MGFTETELLQLLVDQLHARLPQGWRVELESQPQRGGPDAVVAVTAPSGQASRLVVEAKRVLPPKDVPRVVEQLYRQTQTVPGAGRIVVAPYISPRAREMLVEKKVNYWDSVSNAHLEMPSPAVFIGMTGADKNPEREARPLQSLRGQAASRAVRALCDFRPPYGIRELATRSETPAPTLSRVVNLLEREAIVERESPRGSIVMVDWEPLLRRWVEDYDFTKSNETAAYLEPRGLASLLKRLRQTSIRYAVTASLAAEVRGAAVSAPRLATVFVENVDGAAEILKLRPAETGGNVLLAEPYNPVVFDRTLIEGDVVYTAATQTAADLLTGSGRGPANGEALIGWMKKNEDGWRS